MRRSIASVAVAAALLGAALADPAAADAGPASAAARTSVTVAATPAVTVLTMGDTDGFAVHNGLLYSWGDNTAGKLGDASTSFHATPASTVHGAVPLGVSITQVSAGIFHTLAVDSDGKAYAWGDNTDGALGIGTDGAGAGSSMPVAVSQGAIPAGVKIVKVVAGRGGMTASGDESWALASNGNVYGWGKGAGFLGDGGTTSPQDSPVKIAAGAIPAGVKIVDIAASPTSGNVALAGSNGKLYVFGQSNAFDELGSTDTSLTAATPVAVAAGAIPAGVKITQLAASESSFSALGSNGKVYVWGAGNLGQLGNGSTSVAMSATPVAVKQGAIPAAVRIVAITAHEDGTIALGSNGKAYSWGRNDFGELGNGTTTTSATPVAVQQGAMPAGVTIVAVASGTFTVAALGSDGNVYAWGLNNQDRIGDGTFNNSAVPVRVAFPTIDTRTTLTVGGTRRFGATITLTARVIPADTAGTVRFTSGATALGSVKITSGSGTAARVAALTTTRLKVGDQTVTAVFTPSSAAKYTSSRASVAITVAKAALKAGTPRVTGLVRVGRVLTASPGAWTAGAKLTYQWLANLRPIPGAHFKTLHLTKAVRGKKIRVRVTGSKPNFTTVAKASNPTVAVKPA